MTISQRETLIVALWLNADWHQREGNRTYGKNTSYSKNLENLGFWDVLNLTSPNNINNI